MQAIKPRLSSILVLAALLSLNVQAQEKKGFFSGFKDSEDGAFDMSDYLLTKKGFLIEPTIITEPAIGYGAGAGARLVPFVVWRAKRTRPA